MAPTERIVFLADRPEFLYEAECAVRETYDFGPDVGSAAYVECDTEVETTLEADDRVLAVEENREITLPIEPEAVSEAPGDLATIEDVRRLHDVPAGEATGQGVTVVAMDSGVDTSHPVFEGDTVRQVDVTGSGKSDSVGHGTAVLGQITRLAPGAELISLRIFGGEGSTATNVIMRAYEWLHNNTASYDVVNMSWGSSSTSREINRVHDALIEKGIRGVVSAGNSGERAGSPATARRAFGIAACTEGGEIADFSSYNPDRDNPNVAAIGVDNRLAQASGTTLGEDLPGPWVKASGTSFSAPAVAGMVAKYLDARGETPPGQIKADFEETARDIPNQPRDGAGLVDYAAAVGDRGSSPPSEPQPQPGTTTAIVQDLLAHDVLYLGADWLDAGEYRVRRRESSDGEGIILAFRELPSEGDRGASGNEARS
jgi:subtilisin family serine protease